ncbi:hypothetical protein FS749_002249, partial [Ceratobasidium sp. UAMH 11750]
NFLELESSANETGQEDPLALKLGQILARRAADATRTIGGGNAGRSNSRAGYGGAALEDLDKLVEAERLETGKGKEVEQAEGVRVARPRPPPLDWAGSSDMQNTRVVIDDRSPHDGPSFLARIAGSDTSIALTPLALGLATKGPRNEPERERRISFSSSRDRSFIFPAPALQPEPELEMQEITNLAVRGDMPALSPPALSAVESISPVEIARLHYMTPATTMTYGRITTYSARTASSYRSRRTTTPAPPAPAFPPVYPEAAGVMTSHPNPPMNPSHHSVALPTTTSRTSIPLIQLPLDPQYVPRSSTSSDRLTHTAVDSNAVAPAGVNGRCRTWSDGW